MIFASLFAGIGGFDLGFERAGMTCEAQVEINPEAMKILENRYPQTRKFNDVCAVTGDDLGPVRLVCGGFPCQDLSLAGRRAGLAGDRSGLFWEYARILDEVRPEWCVIENVPGLLSSNGGRDMGTVLRELGNLGFWWAYRVLDSQFFGLAQRRKRVFIVGSSRNRRAPAEVLFDEEGVPGPFGQSGAEGAEVAGTLGGGSGTRGWSNDFDRMTFVSGPVSAITANSFTGGPDDNNAQAGHIIPFDKTQITSPDNRSNPQHGDPTPPLAASGKVAVAIGFNHLQDPISSTESSPPIGAKSQGMGVFDEEMVRRLSPKECERIQGFPDDWTEGHADYHRYRVLGNAVSPPVAEWIGRRLMERA